MARAGTAITIKLQCSMVSFHLLLIVRFASLFAGYRNNDYIWLMYFLSYVSYCHNGRVHLATPPTVTQHETDSFNDESLFLFLSYLVKSMTHLKTCFYLWYRFLFFTDFVMMLLGIITRVFRFSNIRLLWFWIIGDRSSVVTGNGAAETTTTD